MTIYCLLMADSISGVRGDTKEHICLENSLDGLSASPSLPFSVAERADLLVVKSDGICMVRNVGLPRARCLIPKALSSQQTTTLYSYKLVDSILNAAV